MLRHAALAGVLSALTLAGTASADPGNGAQHHDYAYCREDALGVFCAEGKGVIQSTANSNVIQFFVHTEGRVTFTGAAGSEAEGCSQTEQFTTKIHYLYHIGVSEPQVLAYKSDTVMIVVDCFGESVTCALTPSYHYVNGRLQYNRQEGSCQPQ